MRELQSKELSGKTEEFEKEGNLLETCVSTLEEKCATQHKELQKRVEEEMVAMNQLKNEINEKSKISKQ